MVGRLSVSNKLLEFPSNPVLENGPRHPPDCGHAGRPILRPRLDYPLLKRGVDSTANDRNGSTWSTVIGLVSRTLTN